MLLNPSGVSKSGFFIPSFLHSFIFFTPFGITMNLFDALHLINPENTMNNLLEVGQPAPMISGETQSGEAISLADFRGKKVVIYFYPKDDTPGCTKQACNLRDNWSLLKQKGIEVIGISADDVKSHGKFAQKFSLPFPLIADTDHQICEAFGVWGERNFMGRKYMGIARTTFVIDENGLIEAVFAKPKVSQHTEEILAAIEA
jgi:peroxiredoxin Q/BCP